MIYEEEIEAVTTRVQGFLDTIAEHDNITVLEGTQPTPVTQEAEMAVAESWAAKYDRDFLRIWRRRTDLDRIYARA